MKLRSFLHGIQWINVMALVGGILSNATGLFPALQANKSVLIVQAILGALLPSFAGISHKIDGSVVKN